MAEEDGRLPYLIAQYEKGPNDFVQALDELTAAGRLDEFLITIWSARRDALTDQSAASNEHKRALMNADETQGLAQEDAATNERLILLVKIEDLVFTKWAVESSWK